MKIPMYAVSIVLFIFSRGGSCQCAKPEISAIWDSEKQQFRCVARAGSEGLSNDETVSPKGSKEFCSDARDHLLKVCPPADEGKTCKSRAKGIFNACYKDSRAQTESQSGTATTPNKAAKTDPAVCMQTFRQQQQACQSRNIPAPSPGQPSAPDTCLQDALAAQNTCLKNSR